MVTALSRIPEPQVADAAAAVDVYDKMDHAAVNERFCEDFLAAVETAGFGEKLHDGVDPLRVLDVGTGTARIPISLARRPLFLKPVVVDPDEAMLNRARLNMYASGLQANITIGEGGAPGLPFDEAAFDTVISNSVIHHVDEAAPVFADMLRVLRPGGLLFVRDLARPASEEDVDRLVAEHAAGETDAARAMLADSLKAAYTTDEIVTALEGLGIDASSVTMTSDRHWTLSAVKPA